jgi:hypothetical protein
MRDGLEIRATPKSSVNISGPSSGTPWCCASCVLSGPGEFADHIGEYGCQLPTAGTRSFVSVGCESACKVARMLDRTSPLWWKILDPADVHASCLPTRVQQGAAHTNGRRFSPIRTEPTGPNRSLQTTRASTRLSTHTTVPHRKGDHPPRPAVITSARVPATHRATVSSNPSWTAHPSFASATT